MYAEKSLSYQICYFFCVLFFEKICGTYTDKKENQIFLIYKEIQKGAAPKSDMTNGLLILCMVKYLRISSYIRKPFLIYDFATAPI